MNRTEPLVFENRTTIGDHDEHQATLEYIPKMVFTTP